ncbi:hypothetical protein ACFZBU_39180 [Embleya sp. NPDC008237]|uniref:hypothetical protein n=1 Tax=Embleya sp. NPDC008237 TaxID=3363978 RepID=UPI0036F0A51C
MTRSELPDGWTLQRIRDVSGDREAVVLDTDRVVTYLGRPHGPDEVLQPEIVLGFHGLCVVKAVDDDDWYMGGLNSDGTIECWEAYDDLRNALRGL